MKLEKIEIYFWEGMEECKPSQCQFRLEVIRNGLLDCHVGSPTLIRKKMKWLQTQYKVKFPKVSWKAIVGDDNGGDIYKWGKR
jgi:hypothetical protein